MCFYLIEFYSKTLPKIQTFLVFRGQERKARCTMIAAQVRLFDTSFLFLAATLRPNQPRTTLLMPLQQSSQH
jgi:hypothetical protein